MVCRIPEEGLCVTWSSGTPASKVGHQNPPHPPYASQADHQLYWSVEEAAVFLQKLCWQVSDPPRSKILDTLMAWSQFIETYNCRRYECSTAKKKLIFSFLVVLHRICPYCSRTLLWCFWRDFSQKALQSGNDSTQGNANFIIGLGKNLNLRLMPFLFKQDSGFEQ